MKPLLITSLLVLAAPQADAGDWSIGLDFGFRKRGTAVRVGVKYDDRMAPALEIIMKKQKKNGRWPLQAKHPGAVHFDMEKVGQDSRWNTLRALRVLERYGEQI